MIWIRSLLFNAFYYLWLVFTLSFMWLFLPLDRRVMQRAVRFTYRGHELALRVLCGISYECRGRENVPEGPAIFACKHQSAWDTGVFYLLFDDPIYVLKKELLSIPFWGWYARKSGSIAVDRRAGASALKALVRDVERTLAGGSPVIIFPEGTRTEPGTHPPFQPGIAALYNRCRVPVVPVALNSGLFWGRRKFRKNPGKVILEFLPPMPAGLDRATFMAELQRRIEEASDRLLAEARSESAPPA